MTKTKKTIKHKIPLSAKQFKKLSLAKRAVLLAKDVLQQIRLRKIVVESGTYVDAHHGLPTSACDLSLGTAAGKKALAAANCHVCAKGALFVANALRTNSCTVGDVVNPVGNNVFDSIQPVLEKRLVDNDETASFDRKSWNLMETAFECDSGYGHESNLSWDDRDAAESFGLAFDADEQRLVAIMLNVIENKGVFDPTKRVSKASVREVMATWKPVKKK